MKDTIIIPFPSNVEQVNNSLAEGVKPKTRKIKTFGGFTEGEDAYIWWHADNDFYHSPDSIFPVSIKSIGKDYIHVEDQYLKYQIRKTDLSGPSRCLCYCTMFPTKEAAESALQIHTQRKRLWRFFHSQTDHVLAPLTDEEINTLYSLVFETPGAFADRINKAEEKAE